MALIDRAIERYSAQYLRNLSNPDSAAASSNDTTRLQLAVDDAEDEFEFLGGVVYDETNRDHVRLAVEGVIVVLKERGTTSSEGAAKARETWTAKMTDFRQRVGSEDRILPATTGVGVPSSEQVTTETVRPKFDDPKFDDLTPGSPRGGQRSSEDDF